MEADAPEAQAQQLYQKAVAAGLVDVAVEYSKTYIFNFRTIGRKTEYARRVAFRGSEEQLATLKTSLDAEENIDIDFERIGPSAGEDCPSMTVFSTLDGAPRQLDWQDPKVYLLDFWATWCQPCLRPMEHTHEILTANADWSQAVEVVAVSVDDTREEAEKRIQERGWTTISSYWAGEGSFKAPPPTAFCVGKLPTCILVKGGKILWRGHPAERDLEADIKNLLRGEAIAPNKSEEDAGPIFTGVSLTHKLGHIENVLGEFAGPSPRITSPYFVYTLTTVVKHDGVSYRAVAIAGGAYKKESKEIVEGVVERMKQAFPVIVEKFRFQ